VDGHREPALGSRFEDREVARLAVGTVGAPAEEHLHKPFVLGRAADLGRRSVRILRRTENGGPQARLGVEPPLAEPLVVGACKLGGPVRARHQRNEDGIVAVQDAHVGPARVEQLALDGLDVGARRAPVLLDVLPEPGGRVRPGIPGEAERRALRAEPVALRGIHVGEQLLRVADLRVDVAVDHALTLSRARP
jgi:hypothetical protein